MKNILMAVFNALTQIVVALASVTVWVELWYLHFPNFYFQYVTYLLFVSTLTMNNHVANIIDVSQSFTNKCKFSVNK